MWKEAMQSAAGTYLELETPVVLTSTRPLPLTSCYRLVVRGWDSEPGA